MAIILAGCVLGLLLLHQLYSSSSAISPPSPPSPPPPQPVPSSSSSTPDIDDDDDNTVIAVDDEAKPQKPETPSSSLSTVTIITGTHLSPSILAIDERLQDAKCERLATAVHLLWSAWEVNPYAAHKQMVRDALTDLASSAAAGQPVHCLLAGSRKHNMVWTFPLAWRPDAQCDAKARQMLATKQYMREKTKVYVNWFLLRPDLVTLAHLASVVEGGVRVRFAVSVGSDVSQASFSQELMCPRIGTILGQREVYKQRFLLVMASDVDHQLQRMRNQPVVVTVIGQQQQQQEHQCRQFAEWTLGAQSPACGGAQAAAVVTGAGNGRSHLASLWHLSVFAPPHSSQAVVVPKTVFSTPGGTAPRLVFVAGLEGVGHHLFALLGRKHTTRELYDSLTDHLCDSAWDEQTATTEQAPLPKYAAARTRLVNSMRALLNKQQPDNVVFLNTVYVDRDVNMYSFPWGGPRCYLKRYARVLCNIDLIELTRMAEEAGIDFRVVFLRRSIGAAVVSASLHRPFGTLVSETRMLALSWALLKTAVESIDRRFVLDITYEDMVNKPEASTQLLGEFLGFAPNSVLHEHFLGVLRQSNANHPVGDGTRWKQEVDMPQFQFMSDLLGL